MPYAKVNDINMYYEIHGEGESLVLIPGMQGGGEHFTFNLPSLSEHFMVITVDNRGAGLSDKPDIPYTLEMMASDIACLLDILEMLQIKNML